MNDQNPDSASYLLDAEVRENLRIALEMGSGQDFGMSWIPLPQTELLYRVYREEGQLYVCVGRVHSDDSVEKCGADIAVDGLPDDGMRDASRIPCSAKQRLEAIESELKKLVTLFG